MYDVRPRLSSIGIPELCSLICQVCRSCSQSIHVFGQIYLVCAHLKCIYTILAYTLLCKVNLALTLILQYVRNRQFSVFVQWSVSPFCTCSQLSVFVQWSVSPFCTGRQFFVFVQWLVSPICIGRQLSVFVQWSVSPICTARQLSVFVQWSVSPICTARQLSGFVQWSVSPICTGRQLSVVYRQAAFCCVQAGSFLSLRYLTPCSICIFIKIFWKINSKSE